MFPAARRAGHGSLLCAAERQLHERHTDHRDRRWGVPGRVTKDRACWNGQLLSGSLRRLLAVATGNITNTELLAPFQTSLAAIIAALSEADFV